MLYELFNYLDQLDVPGAGVFKYVSFRSVMAFILALFISTAIGRRIIDRLRRLQIGEPVALYVVAPFTDAELGLMATVDQAISDVMQGEGFDAKPLPDQAAAVKAVLDRLASSDPGIEGYSSPLVVEGSVEYDESARVISFQYAVKGGIGGGVLFDNWDDDVKGGDAERQPADADRVPAGAEMGTEGGSDVRTAAPSAGLPTTLAIGAALAVALGACLLLRLRRGRG